MSSQETGRAAGHSSAPKEPASDPDDGARLPPTRAYSPRRHAWEASLDRFVDGLFLLAAVIVAIFIAHRF